jgi:BolA protein
VNSTLAEELATTVHALSIKTATVEKWQQAGGILTLETPNCLGGSKHDKK